jgi:hypothetical protein
LRPPRINKPAESQTKTTEVFGFYNLLPSSRAILYCLAPNKAPKGAIRRNIHKFNWLQKNREMELSQNFPIDGATVNRSKLLTKLKISGILKEIFPGNVCASEIAIRNSFRPQNLCNISTDFLK